MLPSLPVFRNINLSNIYNYCFLVVLYGYETWFLIQREKHGLRVFENRVPRKVLGHLSGVEVTTGWTKLHS
jgi:hypothetical protein